MNNYKKLITSISPAINSETLADAVVAKTQIIKRKKYRKTCTLIITIFVLMGFTITAGAVSGWDYSAVARYFFGGSQIVAEGMHDEINYTVVENTIQGITFEITGLYVYDMTIMLSIEASSQEPFDENSTLKLWPERDKALFDHSLDEWISCRWSLSGSYGSDMYKRTLLYKLDNIEEPIPEGSEYSIVFTQAEFYIDPDFPGNRAVQGRVEIKFAIDKLALMNSITINPNVELDNGNIIDEIRINPFNIFISANGQTGFDNHDVHEYISLVDIDGKEIKLTPLSYIYDKDGRWLKFNNENGIITVIQRLEDFPVAYTGPIYDEDGNEITYIYDGTRSEVEGSSKRLQIDIYAYNIIDVNNLSAIILYGEKIPIR